jgi:hypothetical protein
VPAHALLPHRLRYSIHDRTFFISQYLHAQTVSCCTRTLVFNMGTRNNPSPGGLRPGLDDTQQKTRNRTRKQPVRASKATTASDASDSDGEVATMTQPPTQTQSEINPFTFDPHPSAPGLQAQSGLSKSIEPVESRPVSPLPSRRHNTRSSRSVSPSLHNNHEINGRTESSKSKGKGKGRARSTSISSTQDVEAPKTRGGKRKASSENGDGIDYQTTKRAKSKHIDPADRPQPATRKRNLRSQPPGSPIIEVDEEEQVASDNRVVKRTRRVQKLPQEELEFSYAHINTPPHNLPQASEEQNQVSISEPSTSRTPHSTSIASLTTTQISNLAQPSQRSDAEPKTDEIAEQRATHDTSTSSTPQEHSIKHTDAISKPNEVAEERALNGTPTLSTPRQPATARIDAHSNSTRAETQDADQQQSAGRIRSMSSPPLPTLKNPNPVRPDPTTNDSPILRQGFSDTRVAQGSTRGGFDILPSKPVETQAYLHKLYGKPRSRVLHPVSKAVVTMGPIEVYEDSEPEEDGENPLTAEEFKEWKSDLKVARLAYERVLAGERLPEPEPSSNGKEKTIVSCSTDHSRSKRLITS